MAYLPAGAEDYDGGWEMALEDYQARLLDLDILVDADPEYDDLFDDFEDFSDNDLSFDWDDMEEDEDNEIYTCVQDAPILLPQLRFYQDPDDTSKRWPRIRDRYERASSHGVLRKLTSCSRRIGTFAESVETAHQSPIHSAPAAEKEGRIGYNTGLFRYGI